MDMKTFGKLTLITTALSGLYLLHHLKREEMRKKIYVESCKRFGKVDINIHEFNMYNGPIEKEEKEVNKEEK